MAERGTLRIYLGAAPGVGKTYDMLNEGNRLRQHGTDVVVGFVETHGRDETAAQIRDLEVVPRKRLTYRGASFEEMDTDAVLARKPAVALVDELAHTNVPGSRHEKRWQDVDDLLDAGIDVIGTLNIQHLESVNDVVAGITGVRQRETIPDAWVRTAEQIELVDLTPDQLRRRLAYGNVYAAEKIDAALRNYFRPGNLAALREIALLWTADRVDEALQRYRQEMGIVGEWETRERVVVALTGDEGGDTLIRRAARITGRARGDLLGVHVETSDGLAEQRPAHLDQDRKLLEGLGGTYVEVVGADVATALLQVARAENASQIVLGATRRTRWSELVRGSVINRVIRDSGDIDVHVISRMDEEEISRPKRPRRLSRRPLSLRRQVGALLLAGVTLPVLTAVLILQRENVGLPSVLLLYLLVAVVVATVGGIGPAVVAALGALLLADFYFTEPYGSLAIRGMEETLGIIAFLVVAGLVSVLVDQSARRSLEAARARSEAEALARLAAPGGADTDPLTVIVEGLCSTFDLEAVAVLHRDDGQGWVVEAAAGERPPSSPDEGTDTIAVGHNAAVVLRAGPGGVPAEDRRVLSAYASRIGSALRDRELSARASEASTLADANALRTALLSAVSHDLRTPLSTIKASVTSLLERDVDWPPSEVERFLRTIADETDRLNRLVGNLLDMSRLSAGALELSVRPVGLDEVLPAALTGLPRYDARVVVDVPETLPLVLADPALLERAIANLVENALQHSPGDGKVRLQADRVDGMVELRIVDRGPGIPERERERVFRPFQRLNDSGPQGTGLGLAIARGFIEAMGGTLTIDDTPGGGTTVAIRLRRRG